MLLHGSAHGAWCWEHWLGALPALGREAYAPSLRNHPGSYAVDDETYRLRTTVDDYADDAAAVAAHIGRPAVVIGHSLGGIVVQRFAQRHLAAGGALAGLVLLTAAPPGQLGPLRDAPLPTDVPYAIAREEARARYFHDVDPDVVKRALERLVPESPSVTNSYSIGAGVPIAPEELACPMLVVSAEHDHSVVPRDDRIARYYGADYHLHPGIGHDVMLERKWAEVLQVVLDWVDARG